MVQPGTSKGANKWWRAISAGVACLVSSHAMMLAQTAGSAYERTVLQIQQQIESGDLKQARSRLVEAGKRFREDGGLENLLGVVEIEEGHAAAAEKAFQRATIHSPKLAGPYLNLGRLYMQSASKDARGPAKALRAYESALTIAPANAEANYQAAVLLMLDKRYDRSLEHIARLDEAARSGAPALAVQCADEAGLGQKEIAERDATALAADRRLTEADVVEILPVLRASQRADLVVLLLTAAGEKQPLSADGLRALGLAQESAGDLEGSRSTLEGAAAADRRSTATLVDLARVAREQKDYKGALGYLAHAREMEPRDAMLLYYFGLASLDMNLLAEARKAFGEAVQLDPESAQINFAMGTVSAFAQDPTSAFPYLRKYLALRPADPAGILALGTTSFRAKDFEGAIPWLKQAAGDTRTALTAHFYLGRIARQQGRFEEALSELKLAMAGTKPERPEVSAELGETYLAMKRYTEAEEALQRATAIDPENYVANFGLLQLYSRTGDGRRVEQAKRFTAIQNKSQAQYQDMMRMIEIRPE